MPSIVAKVRSGARIVAGVALAGALAACASGDDGGRDARSTSAIGARLVPIGGNVGRGLVVFRPYDGGLVMVATISGLGPGPYRIVIHETPVCSSPNGFSAGPPLVLPATGAPVIVSATIYEQADANVVTRVPGLAFGGPSGVEGRSVVLHGGRSSSLEARPGEPNDRIACGVVGAVPTMF